MKQRKYLLDTSGRKVRAGRRVFITYESERVEAKVESVRGREAWIRILVAPDSPLARGHGHYNGGFAIWRLFRLNERIDPAD